MAKTIRYKDVNVATNTEMFALLEAKEFKKAETHYKKCMAEFEKYFPPDLWKRLTEKP